MAVLCAVALVIGLAACGGDDDDDGGSGAVPTRRDSRPDRRPTAARARCRHDRQDFTFDANAVPAGASFEVENKDSTDHTFTADDGSFDVEVPAGETVTVDAPRRRDVRVPLQDPPRR